MKCAQPTNLLNFKTIDMVIFIQIRLYVSIGSGPVPFRDRDWKKHSSQIKDLINECLQMKPEDRIQAADAL